jgi:archaellin
MVRRWENQGVPFMGADTMRKEILFVVLILAAGCWTKLLDESVVNVDPTEHKFREIDAISRGQKVTVSAKTNSGQFNIYVYLDKDRAEVEKEFDKGKGVGKILAQKLNASEANLNATIPANEKAIVAVTAAEGKKAEVKLKISN